MKHFPEPRCHADVTLTESQWERVLRGLRSTKADRLIADRIIEQIDTRRAARADYERRRQAWALPIRGSRGKSQRVR
jgi:hypothetical protein